MHELSISCDRLIGDGDAAKDDEELYKAACEYMSRTERYNRTLSGMRSQYDKTKAYILPSMNQFSNTNANNVRIEVEDKYGITYAELFDEIKRHKSYTAQMWIDEYERLQKEGE